MEQSQLYIKWQVNSILKDKGNLLIFIAGLLTVSMAFVITIILYILFSNLKRPSKILITVIFAAILIEILVSIGIFPLDTIADMLDRFQFEDGKFVGDNRSTEYLDDELNKLQNKTESLFWGHGDISRVDFGSVSSYKTYILRFGLIRCFSLWGLLLLASIKITHISWDKIIYVILFFINIYQRPNIFSLCYFVTIFGGLLFIDYNESERIHMS